MLSAHALTFHRPHAGMNRSIAAALRGTGFSVPDRVVTNDWFTNYVETSDEWIRTRTGICERRFVGPNDTAGTLATTASRHALAAAGMTADDLDMIVCATVTPDHMCPSTACVVQAALGCRPIPAMDLSAACTGFLYALSVGEQFIRTRSAQNVLVIGTDVLSRTIDLTDRNSCILFGDGAGAVVLSATDTPGQGIRSIKLFADGAAGGIGADKLIHLPAKVTLQPAPPEKQRNHIWLNGREVFKFAVRRMIELTQDAIDEAQRLGVEIKLLIPHQVNQRIIDAALDQTGFPAERVMVNLGTYGNTSGASVPIALDEAMRGGRARPGDTVLLVAFGGGLTWGSVLLTL
jgi:3-oxoacyl-[acyl-carrier-protein] synthase III